MSAVQSTSSLQDTPTTGVPDVLQSPTGLNPNGNYSEPTETTLGVEPCMSGNTESKDPRLARSTESTASQKYIENEAHANPGISEAYAPLSWCEHRQYYRKSARKADNADVVTHIETETNYLLKIHVMDEETLKNAQIVMALDLQRTMRNTALFSFPTRRRGVLLVLGEFIKGRSLVEWLAEEEPWVERKNDPIPLAPENLLIEILLAIAELHDKGYTHGDLKPDNMMVDESVCRFDRHMQDLSQNPIKIVDTETVAPFDKPIEYLCGTHHFSAPEIYDLYKIGGSGDMFSFGVIAVNLLAGHGIFGREVFADPNLYQERMLSRLKRHAEEGVAGIRDPLAQDFVQQLIRIDPEERMTARQALNHPFLTKSNQKMSTTSPTNQAALTSQNSLTAQATSL